MDDYIYIYIYKAAVKNDDGPNMVYIIAIKQLLLRRDIMLTVTGYQNIYGNQKIK